jgi:hypothetical protein
MTNTHEVWKPIPGFEGIYEVSNLGRIAVMKNGERFIRKPNTATHYLSISFKKRKGEKTQTSANIHKLVAEAFIGPRPPGCVIRHIDGNRYNNSTGNLCYGTKNENVFDSIRHGTQRGENNGRSVINEACVRAIRLLLEVGVTQTRIANEIGVCVSTVNAIKTGRNWKHVV